MNKTDYPSEEYYLLNRLGKFFNSNSNTRFPLGIGDDACIRNCGKKEQLIFTADTLVEDVHFSFTYMTPEEIGYKALVANLSDCAAMGAIPDSALIQIVFPKKNTKKDIENSLEMFYLGFNKACKKWDFPIVGGDLAGGPCWVIAISLIGRKNKKSRILRRVGAEVGDTLWSTGIPGKSGAGLEILRNWEHEKIPDDYNEFVKKHIAPEAQIETGIILSEDENVHAVIDLSDGISKEC
ncbi:MAG: thiamine-phosphate kinase, partial [Chitinispirillia bacterium]